MVPGAVNLPPDRLRAPAASGDPHLKPTLVAGKGFVYATGIEGLKAENPSHCFRIVYLKHEWLVYSRFFGGRIGAPISFPGPNHEEWLQCPRNPSEDDQNHLISFRPL